MADLTPEELARGEALLGKTSPTLEAGPECVDADAIDWLRNNASALIAAAKDLAEIRRHLDEHGVPAHESLAHRVLIQCEAHLDLEEESEATVQALERWRPLCRSVDAEVDELVNQLHEAVGGLDRIAEVGRMLDEAHAPDHPDVSERMRMHMQSWHERDDLRAEVERLRQALERAKDFDNGGSDA